MEVIEFRKINTGDVYDDHFNDGAAWSRVYEYPLVIAEMKKLRNLTGKEFIHNSSWGFEAVHIVFKEALDALSENCIHSDLKKSTLPKTMQWDITRKPPLNFLENFDFVINISTMEEVDFDHTKVFDNLLAQAKVGGYVICTYDLPGLQVEKFEKKFGVKQKEFPNNLNGGNSRLVNENYAHLQCGIMVIKKTESTLKQDSAFFKRLLGR